MLRLASIDCESYQSCFCLHGCVVSLVAPRFLILSVRLQEYNEEAIRELLEGLAPWNLRVMWASKRFKVSFDADLYSNNLHQALGVHVHACATGMLLHDWTQGGSCW